MQAVSGTLGLGLSSQRMVMRLSVVGDGEDEGKRKGTKLCRRKKIDATRPASAGIPRHLICWDRATRAGVRSVHIQIVVGTNQNMRRAGARITDGQNDVTRNLALDVGVKLLDAAQLEVVGCRENGAGKIGEVRHRWSGGGRKPCVETYGPDKVVRLVVEGGVLPETLRALAISGIVINGVTGANDGLFTAEEFPS